MKKLSMVLLFALVTMASFSQTRVKSYYRKDGTYVSGYTRGGSSHSSYSGGSYSSSSSEEEKIEDKFENSNLKIDENGFNVYVSVLKYKGETISVKQLNKKYSFYELDKISSYTKKFDNVDDVEHKIDSKKITQEETLSLVSEYGWYLKDGILSKNVYSYSSSGIIKLPTYLTHSFEIIKLK